MASVSAFSPAHITGIFTIEGGSSNGAGFTLADGMTTSVSSATSRPKAKISINGKTSSAPVSRAVISRFSRIVGIRKMPNLSISHKSHFPIGYGAGMSAAGALSLSFSLNELLATGLTRDGCARIGFDSEVECGTGLSAIFAEEMGGFITRKNLGGEISRIKLSSHERNMPVVCAFLGPIKTSSIIRSAKWKERITRSGRKALANFWQDKSLSNFVTQSREFAISSGITSPRMKALLAHNPDSAMAMLGETVFEFTEEPKECAKRFKACVPKATIIESRISETGAHLL